MRITPRLASCSSTLCLERSRRTRTATTWPGHSSRSRRSRARRRKLGANEEHRGGNPSLRRPFQLMIDGEDTTSLFCIVTRRTLVHHTALYHHHHNPSLFCKPKSMFLSSHRFPSQSISIERTHRKKLPHTHILLLKLPRSR